MTIHAQIDAILGSLFPAGLWYIQAPDVASASSDTFGAWSIIGGSSFQNLEGDIDISQPRIQISVYAVDSSSLVDTVAAVNVAMLAANVLAAGGTVSDAAILNYSSSVPVDGFEPETHRFYSHMDFYCWVNQ